MRHQDSEYGRAEILLKNQLEIAIDRLGYRGVLDTLAKVAKRRSKANGPQIRKLGLEDYFGRASELIEKDMEELGEIANDNARWQRRAREQEAAGRDLRGPRLT